MMLKFTYTETDEYGIHQEFWFISEDEKRFKITTTINFQGYNAFSYRMDEQKLKIWQKIV